MIKMIVAAIKQIVNPLMPPEAIEAIARHDDLTRSAKILAREQDVLHDLVYKLKGKRKRAAADAAAEPPTQHVRRRKRR